MPSSRAVVQSSLLLAMGAMLSFAMVEITLRFHNPFEFRQKGDRIYLPVGRSYEFVNDNITGLDSTIASSRNSLGFRGPPPPKDSSHLTIIAVGGSTTECLLLADGKTWVDLLAGRLRARFDRVWINNAGLAGHSTHGHIVLLQDYLLGLEPDVILFLVGVNDLGQQHPRSFDALLMRFAKGAPLARRIVSHSELVSLLYNLYRHVLARRMSLGHAEYDIHRADRVTLSRAEIASRKRVHAPFLAAYADRLRTLIRMSRESGILPVFITQPGLLGPQFDEATGMDLATLEINGMNGLCWWEILELYNDVTRAVGAERGVRVVDLARWMPKNSLFYYDYMHFTNAGAEEVGRIVYEGLSPYLENEFPYDRSGWHDLR